MCKFKKAVQFLNENQFEQNQDQAVVSQPAVAAASQTKAQISHPENLNNNISVKLETNKRSIGNKMASVVKKSNYKLGMSQRYKTRFGNFDFYLGNSELEPEFSTDEVVSTAPLLKPAPMEIKANKDEIRTNNELFRAQDLQKQDDQASWSDIETPLNLNEEKSLTKEKEGYQENISNGTISLEPNEKLNKNQNFQENFIKVGVISLGVIIIGSSLTKLFFYFKNKLSKK